jgi:hypothetical protein
VDIRRQGVRECIWDELVRRGRTAQARPWISRQQIVDRRSHGIGKAWLGAFVLDCRVDWRQTGGLEILCTIIEQRRLCDGQAARIVLPIRSLGSLKE